MVHPPKPFLRKRSGISGRLMEKIHYPIRKNIVEQQSNQRPANDNKVEDLNRPYTAGTIDSGCPEDACSVILSPNNNRKDDGIESVVLDVTDCSNSNSAASSKIQNSRSAPSIIHDLSSFSINETNMASPSSSNFGSNDRIMQKKSQVGDVILPETSENSQDTDGTRSRHWRRVISEFTSEAMKKTEIEGDVYAHVKKIENNTMGSSVTERNLAKQLKDLIAHINLARECRHHEYEKLEEIFDEALQENEFFRQQVNELKKRILQLEDDKQTQLENFALKEEAEKIRNADIERLRQENSILNQQRKQKDGSDTAFVNLLKEQISDLRIMVRDFDRQRSELRMQIRKSNTVLKEKNEIIEQLKSEKARLEKRIEVITKNKAAHRGRLAENSLSAQAIARASKMQLLRQLQKT
ncbi:BMA-SAS-4, isoform g [Dirofilaria immitis]|nr:BMA-SAS-4, isoform g [Dirofilaria immitis]